MSNPRPAQPTIGISCADRNTASSQAMIKRVSEAGGTPLVIDNHIGRKPHEDIKLFSGLIVMGNDFDIDPVHYIHRYDDGDPKKSVHPHTKSELNCERASARSKYENQLMEIALREKMPMLGVCGGMQRLNILCGGTLHQHIPDMLGHDKLMQRSHNIPGDVPIIPVVIESGTRMAIIAHKIQMGFVKAKMPGDATVIMENSFRHQSIDLVGKGLRVCAMSDVVRRKDGTSGYLIEAIESTPEGPYGEQFLIGVQWHPEFCASEIGRVLVKDFIKHSYVYS